MQLAIHLPSFSLAEAGAMGPSVRKLLYRFAVPRHTLTTPPHPHDAATRFRSIRPRSSRRI